MRADSAPKRRTSVTFVTSEYASVKAVHVKLPVQQHSADGDPAPPTGAGSAALWIDVRSTGAIHSTVMDASLDKPQKPPTEQQLLLAQLRSLLEAESQVLGGGRWWMRATLTLRIGCLRLTMSRAFEAAVMGFILWSCINLALDSDALRVRPACRVDPTPCISHRPCLQSCASDYPGADGDECRRTVDMLFIADIIFAVVFALEMVLLVGSGVLSRGDRSFLRCAWLPCALCR